MDKSIDLNQQAEFVDSSSLPVAAMVKTKAKASKKCSMPHCTNDAASTRAKFCTACFKNNASLASSKRKVFGGGGGVLGNRGKRSVVRRSAKRALVACKPKRRGRLAMPCQSTPGHCPTVGIGSWNIESHGDRWETQVAQQQFQESVGHKLPTTEKADRGYGCEVA